MRKVRVNLLPLITAIVSQNERSKEIESALGCLVSFKFSLFELRYNDITTIRIISRNGIIKTYLDVM